MKIYITFGQGHKHHVNGKFFDKDSICEIVCESEMEGRDIAFSHFGSVWAFSYSGKEVSEMNENYFPRGIIPLDNA